MLYFIHLTFLQFSVDAIREAVTKKGDVDMHSLQVSQAGMDPNPKPKHRITESKLHSKTDSKFKSEHPFYFHSLNLKKMQPYL
jgi:hypothetical protein